MRRAFRFVLLPNSMSVCVCASYFTVLHSLRRSSSLLHITFQYVCGDIDRVPCPHSKRRPPPSIPLSRMCVRVQERYARKSEAEDLKRVFHRLDSKADGKIDLEELQAIFTQYKHKVSKVRRHRLGISTLSIAVTLLSLPTNACVCTRAFACKHVLPPPALLIFLCSMRVFVRSRNAYQCVGYTCSLRVPFGCMYVLICTRVCVYVYVSACVQSEIEDMIWEVDEDCDKALTWAEFTAMYERCRSDTTCYEPRSLCNIVEFMMNDKDDSGTVSIDEATNHLYLRHGEALVDQALQDIFGASESGYTVKELNMTDFVKSLQKLQKIQIRSRLGVTHKLPRASGMQSTSGSTGTVAGSASRR